MEKTPKFQQTTATLRKAIPFQKDNSWPGIAKLFWDTKMIIPTKPKIVPINFLVEGFLPTVQKNNTNNNGPSAIKTLENPLGIMEPAKDMKPFPKKINITPANRCTLRSFADILRQCFPKIDHINSSEPATIFRLKVINKGGK